MNRIFANLVCGGAALCGIGAPAAPIAAAQSGASDPVVIAGNCIYSDRLAPFLEQGHTFADCDRLEMRRTGGQAELTFSHPARLREIRLRGTYTQADRFTASSFWLRSRREWLDSEGNCDFNRSSSSNPSVVCIVKSGGRFFVVNFIPDE